MVRRMLLAGLVLALFGNMTQAQRRGHYIPQYQPMPQHRPIPQYQPNPYVIPNQYVIPPQPKPMTSECSDALDEVNALRASRGLRPFIKDMALTKAARDCATARALRRLFGHTENDFQFLPLGAHAASAGCAAYPDSYGWMSCCTNENYTFAGAAWVRGADGKRYMHLFVR